MATMGGHDGRSSLPEIYVRHCDPNSTGEGLGSHARRTLYPLLQVALNFGWKVIWEYEQQPCWKDNEYRKSYSQECLELGSWLGFDAKILDFDRDRTIMVPLHLDGGDARFGNLRGAPEIINFVLEEYIAQHGMDKFVGRNDGNRNDPVLITLFGRFEYQDDPSPPVLEWMHRRCREWKLAKRKRETKDNSLEMDAGTNRIVADRDAIHLNIVLHIRVPEESCSQEWKDANALSHFLETLEQTWHQWNACCEEADDQPRRKTMLQLDVFTEESFTPSMEDELVTSLSGMGLLMNESPTTGDSNSTMNVVFRIHRQTPLLPCVESMAVSDLFIPASSYLSSMAAFFHTSLAVLPNESTRHHPYFATHLKYRREYQPNTNNIGSGTSDENEESSSTTSTFLCPIVRVEEELQLKAAIGELWRSKTNEAV